jgi:hypothetical protein
MICLLFDRMIRALGRPAEHNAPAAADATLRGTMRREQPGEAMIGIAHSLRGGRTGRGAFGAGSGVAHAVVDHPIVGEDIRQAAIGIAGRIIV